MSPQNPSILLERLDGLRTELADLAFALERRGRLDAADVAIATSARIEEICAEFRVAESTPLPSYSL